MQFSQIRLIPTLRVRPLLLVALLAVGCSSDDQIKTYVVAPPESSSAVGQSSPSESASSNVKQGEPTDRMIAAIVPSESRAWFLKAVGSVEDMDAAAKPIRDFLTSVRIDEDQPDWEVPEGWKERAGSSMRLATLVVPTKSGELELSVIGLPLVDNWSSQVLDNVNRWRKQLGLPSLSADNLDTATEPLGAVIEGAVLIDQAGWFDGGTMTPGGGAPFANRAPFANATTAAAAPPVEAAASRSDGLTETPPEGWSIKPGSAMRKASYQTPNGAEVTAFVFPATAPAMADPLQNVNRWRGEVGLSPTTEEELAASSQEIKLSGGEATYVELAGETETTLAAMTQRGQQVWFFKLRGPTSAAETDRSAFREWVNTLTIDQ